MRLDLRLQRFHARFEHRALELLGLGALRRLARGQLRAALAARDDLDDERGDDDQKKLSVGSFRMPPPDDAVPGTRRAPASSTGRRRASRRTPTTRRRCPPDLAEGLPDGQTRGGIVRPLPVPGVLCGFIVLPSGRQSIRTRGYGRGRATPARPDAMHDSRGEAQKSVMGRAHEGLRNRGLAGSPRQPTIKSAAEENGRASPRKGPNRSPAECGRYC